MRSLNRLLPLVLLMVATPALAAADPKAQEASDLFIAMCLGHPDGGVFAKQAFDANPDAGRPLGPKELVQAFGGTLGTGTGWLIGTPSSGEVILGYTPALGSCSLLVRGADVETMQAALATGVAAFVGARTGARALPRPEATTTVDGKPVRSIGWDITGVDGHDWQLMALLGADSDADRQHLLSVTLTK